MTRRLLNALNTALQAIGLVISIYLIYMFFWFLGQVLEVLR